MYWLQFRKWVGTEWFRRNIVHIFPFPITMAFGYRFYDNLILETILNLPFQFPEHVSGAEVRLESECNTTFLQAVALVRRTWFLRTFDMTIVYCSHRREIFHFQMDRGEDQDRRVGAGLKLCQRKRMKRDRLAATRV